MENDSSDDEVIIDLDSSESETDAELDFNEFDTAGANEDTNENKKKRGRKPISQNDESNKNKRGTKSSLENDQTNKMNTSKILGLENEETNKKKRGRKPSIETETGVKITKKQYDLEQRIKFMSLFQWENKVLNEPYNFEFNINNEKLGPVHSPKTILESFSLFIDDELIKWIVDVSIKYSKKTIQPKANEILVENSTDFEFSVRDFKLYLALCMLMAQLKKPTIQAYWSTNPLVETPIFSKIMPLNRFKMITRYLSFDLRENNNDSLAKIRYFLDYISNKFKSNFRLFQNLSIDESLLMLKNRCNFRVTIKSKKARQGVKVYKLNDAKTGYCYSFKIYTRDEETLSDENSKVDKYVFDLLGDENLNKGHVVYFDNYFTSLNLIRNLLSQKTHCVGIMRVDRKGLPEELKSVKLNRGEMDYYVCKKNNILLLKYVDRSQFYMASTIHKNVLNKIGEKVPDYIESKTYIKRPKLTNVPECVYDYNQNMGGVDKQDQRVSYAQIARKTRRVFVKLFMYFVDICIYNASVLFPLSLSMPDIRLRLATEIIRESITDFSLTIENSEHIPIRNIKNTYNIKDRTRKTFSLQCRYCKKYETKRSETVFKCLACNIPLHMGSCFSKWHQFETKNENNIA
jgi:hypothetical protein